ncbi:MAG: heme-binding domain-containing protein [Bacteroidetes bacterium]|nr:heme-binding domain-containing protein [Bacteroidota bacterium]
MKKFLYTFFSVLILLLIIIQFFRPAKNSGDHDNHSDLLTQAKVLPLDLRNRLVTSCYDCHSDNTRYPWYGRIAPVSWLLYRDIKEGKENVNFSGWANYDARKRISLLSKMHDELEERSMPLKIYLWMHKDARMSDAEYETLMKWTIDEAEILLKN